MSREFPLSDRYGDETQNPPCRRGSTSGATRCCPRSARSSASAGQARRRAEALSRLCDENGFAEEEEGGELTKPRLTNPPKAATI